MSVHDLSCDADVVHPYLHLCGLMKSCSILSALVFETACTICNNTYSTSICIGFPPIITASSCLSLAVAICARGGVGSVEMLDLLSTTVSEYLVSLNLNEDQSKRAAIAIQMMYSELN